MRGRQIGEEPLADKARGPRAAARMTVTALIVAAGSGQRLGGGLPKQYRMLGGRSVVARAIDGMVEPSGSQRRAQSSSGRARKRARRGRSATRDVGDFIIGGAERADFGEGRPRRDRERCGPDPRRRAPFLPARGDRPACSPASSSSTAPRRSSPSATHWRAAGRRSATPSTGPRSCACRHRRRSASMPCARPTAAGRGRRRRTKPRFCGQPE